MTRDPWQEPTAKRWVRHVINDMVPKLKGSVASISIVPDSNGDVKFWVELGAAIMMDKPIIAVAIGHRQVPEKLRLVADEIVYMPDGVNEDASEAVAAALTRVMEKLDS